MREWLQWLMFPNRQKPLRYTEREHWERLACLDKPKPPHYGRRELHRQHCSEHARQSHRSDREKGSPKSTIILRLWILPIGRSAQSPPRFGDVGSPVQNTRGEFASMWEVSFLQRNRPKQVWKTLVQRV